MHRSRRRGEGFGTTLIRGRVPYELKGRGHLTLEAEGMPKLNHHETPDAGAPVRWTDLQRVFHLGDGRWWDAKISG